MKRGQEQAPDTHLDGPTMKKRCIASQSGAASAGDQIAFPVATSAPLAPKLPLWTDSKATTHLPPAQAHSGVCLSLNGWAHTQLQGNSLSLNPLNGAAGSDSEDVEDTATSSCSSSSSADSADSTVASEATGATAAAATAASAEDEGDSQQPRSQPAPVFSFGQRACVAPDLAGSFEQWEVVETLLALGQFC